MGSLTRWWQLKDFLFSPLFFGEDEPNLTVAYFSDGLVKNHHLGNWFSKVLEEVGPCFCSIQQPFPGALETRNETRWLKSLFSKKSVFYFEYEMNKFTKHPFFHHFSIVMLNVRKGVSTNMYIYIMYISQLLNLWFGWSHQIQRLIRQFPGLPKLGKSLGKS